MRASTLFSVTIALLLGLGVAVGAKYSGLFSAKPPAPLPPPKVRPKVLVAAKNLFDGYTILQGDVAVRDMTEEEEVYYQEHKENFLPPKVEAGILRVLNRSVEADQPILRDYVDDVNLPQSINKRLSSPSMRAVNVTVPLERAAGGMIQRGEFVDVYLTTRIAVIGRARSTTVTQTAPIARSLKVIVKRNMLWDALTPVDTQKKTIELTLEANVYRAALIEYAKTKGDLTLVPTAAPQAGKGSSSYTSTAQNDTNSKEYADEDARVEACQRGELSVGDADLERIFNLKPPDIQAALRPVQVEQYTGTHLRGVQTFGGGGGNGNALVRPNTGQPNYYSFAPIGSGDRNGSGYYNDNANNENAGELSTSNPAYRLVKPRDNTYTNDNYSRQR